MSAERWGRIRIGWLGSFGLGLLAGLAVQTASAADCPGHPDALGTSRTLVVDPRAHPRIGAMQYQETLPLRDHEVVLSFDDGPLPRYSDQVLQILADQCIKATFFTIGRQAEAYPDGVRKLLAAGHTIATHSETHPETWKKMSLDQTKKEIDQGIASTAAALNDPAAVAPFFRFPGLEHSDIAEQYLASKGIQVWSADFLADDWRHISSAQVYDLAIKRLEARGRGILLLHDIHERTVEALPRILHELKVRGYHIVHVVPATPQMVATATEPGQWQLHPVSETVPIARWPKVGDLDVADTVTLPAPAPSDLGTLEGELPPDESFAATRRSAHAIPLPREAPWPRQLGLLPQNAAIVLPVPAANLFEIAEKVYPPLEPLPLLAHHPQRPSIAAHEPGVSGRSSRALHATTSRRSSARHTVHSAQKKSRVADAGRNESERESTSGARQKAAVRLASLKKR